MPQIVFVSPLTEMEGTKIVLVDQRYSVAKFRPYAVHRLKIKQYARGEGDRGLFFFLLEMNI